MFNFESILNHMLEQGEPAACATGGQSDTLADAIERGCKEQENQPYYDGRGPKSVSVSFACANTGEDQGVEFNYYGDEWTPEVTAACTLHITEAFNVGRTYYNWGC